MGRCFHIFPLTMLDTWTCPSPYCSATVRCFSPPAMRLRIAITSSAVRIATGFVSPGRLDVRPREVRSSTLSCWVPPNRWPGLQHGGLSHVCRMVSISSGQPLAITKATRCTRRVFPSHQNRPYPRSVREPFHGQQSSAGPTSTRSQKRLASSCETANALIAPPSGSPRATIPRSRATRCACIRRTADRR